MSAWDVIRGRMTAWRARRRLEGLRRLGMGVGAKTYIAPTVWFDWAHCYLIRIGDRCRLEDGVLVLAHDAQMDEFLDAGRLGRVVIHDQSVIGARAVILPGVEIGPRTIVAPHAVVTRSCPPDTVCAGNPARPVGTMEDYLADHRTRMAEARTLSREEYDGLRADPSAREAFVNGLGEAGAYLVEKSQRRPPRD